jgi:hypothetical protein
MSALANAALAEADADRTNDHVGRRRWSDSAPLAPVNPEQGRSEAEQHRHAGVTLYPVWRLADRELRLPIIVQLESDEHEVIVGSSALRIWGVGPDRYRALEDFKQTFEAILRSYSESPEDELTARAVQYRDALLTYVR